MPFDGSVRYLFGPENTITAGYRNDFLDNEEYNSPFEALTPDDGTIQTPYGSLAYWLNDRNGVEFEYDYVSANFSQKSETEPGDDYEGHRVLATYHRRHRHPKWRMRPLCSWPSATLRNDTL